MLVVGLGMAICGIALLFDDTAKCGNVEMKVGDLCTTYSRGSETTRTLEQQRGVDEFMAGVSVCIGVVLTLGVLATFFGKAGVVPDRRALAEARDDWQYRETDEQVLGDLRETNLVDPDGPARDVLHGTLDGLRFAVFDVPYHSFAERKQSTATAWLVYLPPTAPPGFSQWAAAQRRLFNPGMNNAVDVSDHAIFDVRFKPYHVRKPDGLLRPVQPETRR
jgi:hypothetical protein